MKFYRFIADIQLFGYFFMRKVLNTTHYKNFSGTFWQKIQSVIDYFLCFSRQKFHKCSPKLPRWQYGYSVPIGHVRANCSDTSLITVFVLKIIQTFMFDNRKHIRCGYH